MLCLILNPWRALGSLLVRWGETSDEARKMTENTSDDDQERKPLSEAAKRALAEAEARRQAKDEASDPMVRELGGRDGPEPTRFGDWENKGITSDF